MDRFTVSTTNCPVQASFTAHDHMKARYLNALPVCEACGEPIDADHYYNVYGEYYCDDCMEKVFRHDIEDFLEGNDD